MGSAPPPANPIEVAPGVIRGTAAPAEVSQPLTDDAIAQQLERAAANERSLQPLAFAVAAATTDAANAADPVALTGGRRIRQVKHGGSPAGSHAGGSAVDSPADGVPEPVYQPSISDMSRGAVDGPAEPKPWQPAASNTDSPSRGVPRNISNDPGKQITGGFGDIGDAQYFPLDGTELRELISALMDDVHARMQDDLRFTMAICYPRVRARVEVIVEAFVEDQGFTIPRVMVPREKTPIAVARAHGDEIIFTVIAQREEMTDSGESVTAPNATRLELGLPVPRKQTVNTPTGRMLVDLPNTPAGA